VPICPQCDEEYEPGGELCPNCGETLVEEPAEDDDHLGAMVEVHEAQSPEEARTLLAFLRSHDLPARAAEADELHIEAPEEMALHAKELIGEFAMTGEDDGAAEEEFPEDAKGEAYEE